MSSADGAITAAKTTAHNAVRGPEVRVQRVRALIDTLRANFFVLPAVAVVVAFFGGRLAVGVDLGHWVGDATVESARSVLSTVASATITFASVAFSVSLLIMQQGSSQFSPRVIYGLTRDPFNRRVIALVLATFTYSLVVLQRVRGPLSDAGSEVVPRFAVALGLILGVVAVLGVVAAIHHTSRQMNVSEILRVIVDETNGAATAPSTAGLEPSDDVAAPGAFVTCSSVRFDGDGWVRQMDFCAILAAVDPVSVVRLETDTGRYAIRSTAICTIWPAVTADRLDDVTHTIRRAVLLGPTRTMSEDRSYGVRQIVDVALRALSPGVNDPTTAQDAIFHLGTILAAWLTSPSAPPAYTDTSDRRLLRPHVLTDHALAELALAELRREARRSPAVALYLLEMVFEVVDAAAACGTRQRAQPLVEQAQLLIADGEASGSVDVRQLRQEYELRFNRTRSA